MQIELSKSKKAQMAAVEKKYYKPHFGPEETKDLILWEQNRVKA